MNGKAHGEQPEMFPKYILKPGRILKCDQMTSYVLKRLNSSGGSVRVLLTNRHETHPFHCHFPSEWKADDTNNEIQLHAASAYKTLTKLCYSADAPTREAKIFFSFAPLVRYGGL